MHVHGSIYSGCIPLPTHRLYSYIYPPTNSVPDDRAARCSSMSSVVSEPLDLVRLSLDERIVVSRQSPHNPAAPGPSVPVPARSSSGATAIFGASCTLTIST